MPQRATAGVQQPLPSNAAGQGAQGRPAFVALARPRQVVLPQTATPSDTYSLCCAAARQCAGQTYYVSAAATCRPRAPLGADPAHHVLHGCTANMVLNNMASTALRTHAAMAGAHPVPLGPQLRFGRAGSNTCRAGCAVGTTHRSTVGLEATNNEAVALTGQTGRSQTNIKALPDLVHRCANCACHRH